MKNKLHPTRGSFLLIAIGMLFCVALYSVGYFNYMMMQKRLQDRMEKQGIMSRLATALATLAIHKMQFGPLLAENSGGPFPEKPDDSPSLFPLFQELCKPLAEMSAVEGKVDLEEVPTSDLYSIMNQLVEPLKNAGDFQFSIKYSCDPSDFEACGLAANGYPREKKGNIRLHVNVKFSKGETLILDEMYQFRCRLKITAALTPVLSKFTMYLESATTTPKECFDYNLVQVDEAGEVYPNSPARPIVLDNDGASSNGTDITLPVHNNFNDFVRAQRGLVFMGGPGVTVLNLARSNANSPSTAGETFQMYRDSEGDGFVPVFSTSDSGGQLLTIWQMETGMSPSLHPWNASFYKILKDKAPKSWPKLRNDYKLEHCSIFRLYGVDGRKSATLALGKVVGQTLLPKIYSYPPLTGPPWNAGPRAKLHLYEDPQEFFRETDVPNGMLVPLVDCGLISNSPGEIFRYTLNYASFIASRSYNLGISYAHNQHIRDPWTAFPSSDPLYSLFTSNPPNSLLYGVPAPFNEVVPEAADLKTAAKFVSPASDEGRAVFSIEIPGPDDPDIWTALSRRGLLKGSILTLSGWVHVKKADKKLVIDRPIKYLGNGGLVLEEGDFVLQNNFAPISSQRGNAIFQVIAKKGNIRLETPTDCKIKAALVAPMGKIVFSGGSNLEITGSLAMNRLFDRPSEIAHLPGAKVVYYSPLAALPKAADEKLSEKPLLTFNFELLPLILD